MDRENFATTKNANGLIFNIEVFCKVSELICKDDTQLDFENDKVSMSMAYAIRYKSGELLLEMVLASGQVDRFTLLDNTRLWGKRNHYVKQYNEHTAWICSKVDITQNDCLACDNSEDLQITGILV